ncbi:MAG: sigma-70 family RNA polymerase sigma factor [Candidatus Kapaibacterium sp.]
MAIHDGTFPLGGIGKAFSSFRDQTGRREEANRIAAERTAEHSARQEAVRAEEARRVAFEREAIPHMDALFNFAIRMTLDQPEAEDLVQETYLKAFRFFDKFEEGTNCKAWLFRIMKNSYINRYRKSQKSPETVDYESVQEFYHTIRPSGSPNAEGSADALFANIMDDEVTLAMEDLPEDFRTVVILCDIEGLTYEEIAEFVDCPVGTVRSRLHRGRKLLRDSLLGYAASRGYAPVDVGN